MEGDIVPIARRDTPSVPVTRLTGRLIFIFLAWPIGPATAALLSTAGQLSIGYWMYYVGTFFSPILGGVLIVIALRQRPVLHRFLKFVIVLSLIVLIQTNFACATMASGGHFFQELMQRYHLSSNQTPIEAMVDTYVHSIVTRPPFANDYDSLAAIPWALVQSYAPLTGPFFLLLLLVIPHFLALPVYWLWVVLSILYVVLPLRAWKWIGNTLRKGWSAVWRKKSM